MRFDAARWYSMEMAGVVTHTGAMIIQKARELIDRIGIPLELDTDGIWTTLPSSFPQNFKFTTKSGKTVFLSYPCAMLNAETQNLFTNHQYHELVDKQQKKYEVHSECSILFELDGPYKAMVLPASKEEDKGIKKRYAVFGLDGKLAELKGFEIKRRGELQLIKIFQSEIFSRFLQGSDLPSCYQAVADVANNWLDVLDNQGQELDDDSLLDLISEASTMSRSLEDYGAQKSCAITTARRLGTFLGAEMVADKGVQCNYVISRRPEGSPVTERAIPTVIFHTDDMAVRRRFLRRWLHDPSLTDDELDIRNILDWDYYKGRLGSAIMKIITIPAAIQHVTNPVPRVKHPDWLQKRIRDLDSSHKQMKMSSFFEKKSKDLPSAMEIDIEDMANAVRHKVPVMATVRKGDKRKSSTSAEPAEDAPLPPNVPKEEDIHAWLLHQKAVWRQQVAARKKRRIAIENGEELPRVRATTGMGAFVVHEQQRLLRSQWQIVEIRPMAQPGLFKMWVFTGVGQIQTLTLEVPRVFYINSRKEWKGMANVKEVPARVLPMGSTCHRLLEVVMPEQQFQQNYHELMLDMADPEVEGIYETELPLMLKAIMDLGCVPKLKPKTSAEKVLRQGRKLDSVSLSELEFQSCAPNIAYLESPILAQVYINYSWSEAPARGVIGLFSSFTCVAPQFIVINPINGADRPNFTRMLQQEYTEEMKRRGVVLSVDESKKFVATVSYARTREAAFRELSRIVKELRQKSHAPTMVLFQSALSLPGLLVACAALEELPIVCLPADPQDNQYSALQWQQPAVQRMTRAFFGAEGGYSDRLALARFAHIPIANIEPNARYEQIFVADVFFGRLLRDQKHLLWAQSAWRSDVANDDRCFDMDEERPVLIAPQACRTFCVELEVTSFTINAIINHTQLEEMESLPTAGSEQYFPGQLEGQLPRTKTIADEAISCAPAFKVITQMVNKWLRHLYKTKSQHVDLLLSHFERWLSSQSSKFFMPMLRRYADGLMHKMFKALVEKLTALGATIVYASVKSIILCTGKTSQYTAMAYTRYLIDTIHDEPLFKLLALEPKKAWSQLLFMDRFNFAGFAGKYKELEGEGLRIDEGEDTEAAELTEEDMQTDATNPDSQPPAVRDACDWNLAEFLPKPVQHHFLVNIIDFLDKCMQHRDVSVGDGPSQAGFATQVQRKQKSDEFVKSLFVNR